MGHNTAPTITLARAHTTITSISGEQMGVQCPYGVVGQRGKHTDAREDYRKQAHLTVHHQKYISKISKNV